MPNDFEKRVRLKMDELDFVPGAPVWTKIEAGIQKKKGRRRIIFLLPLLIVLLGGGAIWLNRENGMRNSAGQDDKNVSATAMNSGETKNIPNGYPQNGTAALPDGKVNSRENIGSLGSSDSRLHAATNYQASVSKSKAPGSKKLTIKQAAFETRVKNDPLLTDDQPLDKKDGIRPAEQHVQPVPVPTEEKRTNTTTEFSNQQAGKSVEEQVKADSVTIKSQDTSTKSPQILPKQKHNAKWKYAVVANVGISGMADGLTVLSQEKTADAFANSGTGSVLYPATSNTSVPATITNGVAFSIGGAVVRQLSGQFRFSAGLEYNYFSNHMQVGPDSLGYIRSYSSTGNRGAAGNYTNHFHFISVPVEIAFQPAKKLPLEISAGLALQQLLSTNALVYNSQYHYYENDKKLVTQTQLFSRFGLNYSVAVKKHELSFGPQVNYGLSNLFKNSDDRQLFSFGLKTAFIF